MIRAWQTEILLVAGLLGLAHVAAEPTARGAADVLRATVRPFVLPRIWARFDAASRAGDPGELLAAGRLATELIPGWTDGAIHFGWIAAFELSRERPDRDALADLLLAVDQLEQSAEEQRSAGAAEDAAELLLAAATIVDHGSATDPVVAARIRSELGRDPAAIARDLIARAAEVAPNDATRSQLAFASVALIAGAVRMGDLPRADASVAVARRALAAFAGREDVDEALAALARLRPMSEYLEERAALDALAQEPLLSELADALRALPR